MADRTEYWAARFQQLKADKAAYDKKKASIMNWQTKKKIASIDPYVLAELMTDDQLRIAYNKWTKFSHTKTQYAKLKKAS